MITRALAEPAYKCIRLMDITNCIPLSLDLKSGKSLFKSLRTSTVIHWIIYLTGLLKFLHILSTVVKLMADFRQESFPELILTIVLLSLSGTSMYWGWEMFHKGIHETIILFNSLVFAPLSLQLTPEDGRKQSKRANIMCSKPTFLWLRSKVQMSKLRSLSLQELMILLAPFAVKPFVPMYLLMMAFFPHWDVFITSFMHSKDGWNWGMVFCVGFEAVSWFCFESNILFAFFLILALHVTHLRRIKMDIAYMR